MPDINLHPENDPGGHIGETLHRVAESLSFVVGPYVAPSDEAALTAAEHGEDPAPDPGVTELVHGLEATVNKIGSDFIWAGQGLALARGLMNRVAEMSAEEFADAKAELTELAPNFNWQRYYDRTYKRDPGKIGSFFRPALRLLGFEPPYWR